MSYTPACPIRYLWDVERLITALGICADILPGSIRLSEGADYLASEFREERRDCDLIRLSHTNTPGGLIALFRCLWNRPLKAEQACLLAVEARLAAEPGAKITLRFDIPRMDVDPCWLYIESCNDAMRQTRLMDIYRSLGSASGLALVPQTANSA